jgi:AraC-like DNA-binding protein
LLQFSTDHLRAHERFDYWCEERGRSLFGVTMTLPRERRLDFHGRFSAVAVGGAMLAEMRASAYEVSRTRADISRASSDGLVLSHQIKGPGWLDLGDRGRRFIENDSLGVGHCDTPYAATPTTTGAFHFRVLKIPVAGNELLSGRVHDLWSEPLQRANRLTMLISASFTALAEEAMALSSAEAVTSLDNLAGLVLLARGRAVPNTPESRAALRAGYLHAARRIIKAELLRPDLSPELVAEKLGVSLRQLHVLFEPTGTTFARYVLALRLERARALLEQGRARSVVDIAFDCGFHSIATFYRAFRAAYGAAPRDWLAVRFNPSPSVQALAE